MSSKAYKEIEAILSFYAGTNIQAEFASVESLVQSAHQALMHSKDVRVPGITDVPVGVLPVRTINAQAVFCDDGSTYVLIDAGLVLLLQHMTTLLCSCISHDFDWSRLRVQIHDGTLAYFKAIVKAFCDGVIELPQSRVALSEDATLLRDFLLRIATCQVVGHELGHHLCRSISPDTSEPTSRAHTFIECIADDVPRGMTFQLLFNTSTDDLVHGVGLGGIDVYMRHFAALEQFSAYRNAVACARGVAGRETGHVTAFGRSNSYTGDTGLDWTAHYGMESQCNYQRAIDIASRLSAATARLYEDLVASWFDEATKVRSVRYEDIPMLCQLAWEGEQSRGSSAVAIAFYQAIHDLLNKQGEPDVAAVFARKAAAPE